MVTSSTATTSVFPALVILRCLAFKEETDSDHDEEIEFRRRPTRSCSRFPDLKPTQPERKAPQIDGMLVFDCESRADKTQALTFGSYRFLVAGRCLEEGLFYADDLTADDAPCWKICARASCRHRSARHSRARHPEQSRAPADAGRGLPHAALSRRVQGARVLVAFNFPFDI